ncbi:hypothetical protein C3747_31g117 [Trypanosoma cruzi]|uniref:Tetraspanin n=2 Tax=Trypanosoma cruzi TaxID=5693 RepID=Q4CMQ9_TRYCC|nr:hypothetical protein, conserved [Trypanosoma cruzi]EAN81562.1 hypothetical protein, conserved [Trypanosoma cruzi]PWV15216.1 hypothetical protein C3747_31g117 [Trypanosoma cruzi]RNC53694.1 hypothetical protein TcCL_ESM08957 [Trypanosoma cruzi]|eukprot:XP_803008.1 hypothetical protein [Trypanosoma cruzi strain CL Brener]
MHSVPAYNAYYWVESHDSGCLRFFRALLMGMNILLTAGAVAGLAVGLLERSTMEKTLKNLCQSCQAIFIAYISVFSGLLLFSLLGFFALCTRNTLLRVLYFIYLFVVFLGAFSSSIAYVLVSTDRVNLQTGWDKSAVSNAEGMCSLELQFHCSGWKELCNTSNMEFMNPLIRKRKQLSLGEGALRDVNTAEMLSHTSNNNSDSKIICPTCSEEDQKEINGYNVTCESVVMGTIKEHLKEVLPIGLSITTIALLGMIVTCLIQHETNYETYYGGRYYRV